MDHTAKVISNNLTFNCDQINNWMAQNIMVLNANKTYLMFFRTDKMTKSAGETHVTMSNTVITKTSTEKLLGFYIDQNLKWKTQIKELSSKL